MFGCIHFFATTANIETLFCCFHIRLTNDGLKAILDGCPHLETLDIRRCYNVNMDADMRARCARLRTIRLPGDSVDDYEFEADADGEYCSELGDYHDFDIDYDFDFDDDYENYLDFDDIFDDDDEDYELGYLF
jgi:hypothetical protein